jgi:hypothetical protein
MSSVDIEINTIMIIAPLNGYIEPLENITVDNDLLLQEYKDHIEGKMIEVRGGDGHLQQMMFLLIARGNIETPVLRKMPAVRQLVDKIRMIFDFDFVTYRIIMPNHVYNWHVDDVDSQSTCIHVPLITNSSNLFIYKDQPPFHMPIDGRAYIVNNGIFHTFANASREPRLHLIVNG